MRFYDPDKHIVEVGENMQFVCKRFKAEGMTPGQIAKANGCSDGICK